MSISDTRASILRLLLRPTFDMDHDRVSGEGEKRNEIVTAHRRFDLFSVRGQLQ